MQAREGLSIMCSLASYTRLLITAIGLVEGREDLRGIADVRWEAGFAGSEESSVEDLILWLDGGEGRAYVQRSDGSRGPQIQLVDSGSQRYIRSDSNDETLDALLSLPRLQHVTPAHRTPTHRRGRRSGSRR